MISRGRKRMRSQVESSHLIKDVVSLLVVGLVVDNHSYIDLELSESAALLAFRCLQDGSANLFTR